MVAQEGDAILIPRECCQELVGYTTHTRSFPVVTVVADMGPNFRRKERQKLRLRSLSMQLTQKLGAAILLALRS